MGILALKDSYYACDVQNPLDTSCLLQRTCTDLFDHPSEARAFEAMLEPKDPEVSDKNLPFASLSHDTHAKPIRVSREGYQRVAEGSTDPGTLLGAFC